MFRLQGPRAATGSPAGQLGQAEGGIDTLRSTSDSRPGKKMSVETKGAVGGPTPPAFDSHFHLDRGWRQWGMKGRMDRQRFIEMRLPTPPRNPVNLVGGVMVHCDPGTWPSAWALQEPPRGSPWVTAIRVHPRKAHQLDDSSFGKMEQLVGLPGVRAIGEVGLDQSQRDPPLLRQVGTLRWVLNLCKGRPEVPLILHIRGAPEDHHSAEAHLKVLTTVRERVASQQSIHLHRFNGGMQEAVRWREHSQCLFRLYGEVNKFDQEQGQVVLSLPLERILLESDAPYFRPSWVPNNSYGHPQYIAEVAMGLLAFRSGDTLWALLEATTTSNAWALDRGRREDDCK
ncbi:Hypothetical predicted protein [Mytilus galloprovincialis]|uniref:TatD n=1 Tax=Mytilus galloprovincialis TaxID=29158 RepID=A0A8B6ETG6_MYTGA|nr:Hypothetical predicted protein [Mytilus galloprovincialis]